MEWIKDITLQRRRVRYAWIYVNYKLEVRVVIPLRFREKDVQEFIRAKTPWIQKKLDHYRKLRDEQPTLGENEILFFGKTIATALAGDALERWYRQKAKKHFLKRVPELAAQHGFAYCNISVRDARTRWGSCSAKKNLSFNWRLMKAPEEVIDYIILHELAHTVALDHSRKFWRLVASVCPAYEHAKAWLRRYGGSL